MSAFVPAFVTELTDQYVTDCVPASGLMLVDKITHNRYPASVAEREALQNAMGTQDAAANLQQLAAGILKRYSLRLVPQQGWTALAAALATSTKGMVIVGSYPSLSSTLRVQGNDPTFGGGHAIYAQGNGAGGLVIGDPLAWHFYTNATLAQLKPFADSYGAQFIAGAEQLIAKPVAYRMSVKASTVIFYRVMRFTHALFGAKRVTFSRNSSAPVAHGSPGFWRITGGPLEGYYAVAGHTTFAITAIYANGHTAPVDVRS